MKKSDYSEKLKDPRWQKKRLEIFERDEWVCRECGNEKGTLNVHHVLYLNGFEPWEYPLFLLKTLCSECHEYYNTPFKDLPESHPGFRKLILTKCLDPIVRMYSSDDPLPYPDEVMVSIIEHLFKKRGLLDIVCADFWADLSGRVGDTK